MRYPRRFQWSQHLKKTKNAVVGVLLAIATVYLGMFFEAWGPPWPTRLSIQPISVGSDNPLDIPFAVENRSAWFDAKDVEFYCLLGHLIYEGPITIESANAHEGVSEVSAGSDDEIYYCSFRSFIDVENRALTDACVSITATYRWRWFGSSGTPPQAYKWHPELDPKICLDVNECGN